MPLKFKGLAARAATLKRIEGKFPGEVAAAVYYVGQQDMTEAKYRTPVWNPERPVPPGHTPGSLRASGQVHEPQRDGRRIFVTLSFGDELVDYAIFVHEDPDAFHVPPGQWKFLESVLMESAPNIVARIAARIDLRKVAS